MSTLVNSVFMNISGKRLRDLLDERGIAYRDFATAMGVEPQHVNNWFNRGIPKARIFKVADFLQVNARWLADGEEDRSAITASEQPEVVNTEWLPPPELPMLADRINHAMQQCGLTQQQLAEAAGTSQTTIQKLCSGKSKETKKLNAIAKALRTSTDWLATGKSPLREAEPREAGSEIHLEPLHPWDDGTPLDDDEVEIPLYKEVELAAGSGRTAVREIAGRKLRFSRKTMRAAGVNPAEAVCATISGNSMEPLIMNGATIGLDRGTTHVVDGEIYALEHDGMLRVKFLYRLPGGGIRLRSFNREEHKDEDYTLQQQQDQNIRILGRVFWWSTIRPLKSAPLI